MKIIALDQNAISDLAFPPSATWSEIRDLLQTGVKRGALICPTPTETITESIHLDRSRQESIERLCAVLSCGYFFRFPWEIIAQEALAKIRPGLEVSPFFWLPPQRTEGSQSENAARSEAIQRDRINYENAVNIEMSAEEKSLVKSRISKQFSTHDLAYASATSWLDRVGENLKRMLNGQPFKDEDFIIEQLCVTLMELQVTEKEMAVLLRNVQSGEWLNIPMLTCWFALEGLFTYDQVFRSRRYEYNDEWDKYRAGEAYHCADCFITDRGMAAALKQVGLAGLNDFNVFSVVETKKIVDYLKAAVDSPAVR